VLSIMLQQDTTAVVDTLTKAYSDIWQPVEGADNSAFINLMASNDLIFVVLGVTLIIWFVLLFYMIKIDRRLGKLEQETASTTKE
jgi:CcmD family protein